MRIVDCHVHLYSPEVNRAPEAWAAAHGERHWATLCTRKRKDGRAVQAFPGLDELLRQMDEDGVERVVLQGWYWENPDRCEEQNRFFSDCVRAHPDRLSAFAAIHPGVGADAARTVVRRAKEQGLCGLGELSPHAQQVGAEDPAWKLILAEAGLLRMPVTLHVSEQNSGRYPGRVETPLGDFVRWARAFPCTTFVLAHWGARLPLDPALADAAKACLNLYYDTAASPLIYRHSPFREMADAVGAGRILYGSDHPLNLYPKTDDTARLGAMTREFAGTGLTADELNAVAGGTIINLLKLRTGAR